MSVLQRSMDQFSEGMEHSRIARDRRIAGLAGLAFFVLLVIQNIIRGSGPLNGASTDVIDAYVTQQRTVLEVLFALFPIGLVALFAFAAGLRRLAIDRDATVASLADLGMMGALMIGAMFAVSLAFEVSLVATAPSLTGQPEIIATLWALHGAAFVVNIAGIGVALIGLSQAAARSGLMPPWTGQLGIVGGILLLVGAVPSVEVTNGSPLIVIGLVGFLCWAVWVAMTGLRLVRGQV